MIHIPRRILLVTKRRVLHGGSFGRHSLICRFSLRRGGLADCLGDYYFGFRVCKEKVTK